MNEVTRILGRVEAGEENLSGQLLDLVYDELRQLARGRMAHESAAHTLQPTALVHEAFLRLVGNQADMPWQNRAHFFGAASEAMRRILVESARRRGAKKRGSGAKRLPLEERLAVTDMPSADLLALDEALADLEAQSPKKAELVKLRFFAGCTIDEAAELMGVSRSTAERYWVYARAWLFKRIYLEE